MVGKCPYISSEFDNKNCEYLSVQSLTLDTNIGAYDNI